MRRLTPMLASVVAAGLVAHTAGWTTPMTAAGIQERIEARVQALPGVMGVAAIDLIDIDYPPWHNDTDTMDKLSAQSMEIVGTVVYEVIQRLEHQ